MKVTRHHQHPQAGTQLYTKGLNGHVSSPMLPPSNSLLPYFFFQTEMLIMSLFNMFRMKPKFFSVVCKTLQDMLLVCFSGLISFPHLEQSTSGSPFPSWPVPSGASELPHEPILSQGTCSLHCFTWKLPFILLIYQGHRMLPLLGSLCWCHHLTTPLLAGFFSSVNTCILHLSKIF